MDEPRSLASDPGSSGLVGALTAVGRARWRIALTTLVFAALGAGVSFLLPTEYTGRTVLLPPQQAQGAGAALTGSLGALAASAGMLGAFKSPEELYAGLLRTDSVGDALIRRFKLQERYGEATLANTRRELARRTRLNTDRKSTLISVEVDDREAEVAAKMANAYTEELQKLLTRIAVTEAQQRRLYLERQLEKSKVDLAAAELDAKRAQEQHGVLSLDAQTQTSITSAAQLRAQIVAREVQLQAMRPYAGPENPELKRVLAELGGLRTQLQKIEGGVDRAVQDGRDGADALANVRVFRELKYQEAVYSGMLQQLQLAKAEEAMDAPLVQQVDVAQAPDKRSKPMRSLWVAGAAVLGLLLGLAATLLRHWVAESTRDPLRAQRWRELVQAWSPRR